MALPTPVAVDGLHEDIRLARIRQLDARVAWARSPNAATIEGEKAATRELNVLLDRLLLRRSIRKP